MSACKRFALPIRRGAVRVLGIAATAVAISASAATAQATFTPSFNAPYRAFESMEFGVTFSLPDNPREFGLEGQYRFGKGAFDIGVRGGVISIDNGGSDFVIGIEGRGRVIDHTRNNFPLDGAVIIGIGTAEFDSWAIPAAGLSLGRRVDLEDWSFIAYGQPTLFLLNRDNGAGGNDTDLEFGMGLGIDFKVGQALDLRTSFGFGDGPEGLAVSLVWIR